MIKICYKNTFLKQHFQCITYIQIEVLVSNTHGTIISEPILM